MSGILHLLATIVSVAVLLFGGMIVAGMTELARSENKRSLDVIAGALILSIIASVIVSIRSWTGSDDGVWWITFLPPVLLAASLPMNRPKRADNEQKEIVFEVGAVLLFTLPGLLLLLAR